MAASDSTVAEVVRVVRQHVDAATFARIVRDLRKVKGNQSFTDTIRKLELELVKIGALT